MVFNKQLRFFALSFSIKYKCQIPGGNAPIGYFDFDRAIFIQSKTSDTDAQVPDARAPAENVLKGFFDLPANGDFTGIAIIIFHSADVVVDQRLVPFVFREHFQRCRTHTATHVGIIGCQGPERAVLRTPVARMIRMFRKNNVVKFMTAFLFDKGSPGQGSHNNIRGRCNTHLDRLLLGVPWGNFTLYQLILDLLDNIILVHYFLLR